MELIFNKDELLDAVSKFNRISDGKLNPILGSTLFEVNKNEVTISATNTKIGVSTTLLTNNLNEECGSFAVETAMLLNCINKLKGDVKIVLKEKLQLSVSSGRTKYSLVASESDDFPEMQTIEGDVVEFKTNDFVKGISSTLYCVAEQNDNPRKIEACCVNITAEGGTLSFKAMDGYRLSECNIPIDYSGDPFYAFIPKHSAKFVLDIASKCKNETIIITKSNKHALFIIGDYKITTNTMTANNFDFSNFKNKKIETTVKVKSEDLCLAIEQTIPVIENSSKNPLKFNLDKGAATISSVSTLGKSSSECHIDIDGSSIEIALNSKYILEAIKNINSETIILKMQGANNPVEIYNADNDKNWSIVLPVRMRAA